MQHGHNHNHIPIILPTGSIDLMREGQVQQCTEYVDRLAFARKIWEAIVEIGLHNIRRSVTADFLKENIKCTILSFGDVTYRHNLTLFEASPKEAAMKIIRTYCIN